MTALKIGRGQQNVETSECFCSSYSTRHLRISILGNGDLFVYILFQLPYKRRFLFIYIYIYLDSYRNLLMFICQIYLQLLFSCEILEQCKQSSSRELYKVVFLDCRNNRPGFDSSLLWKGRTLRERPASYRVIRTLVENLGSWIDGAQSLHGENIAQSFYRRPPTVPGS